MKHNDCFDDKGCDPIIITGGCCDPKTVCPSKSQLIELEKLLIALSTAIPIFLTTPNAANKMTLIGLFNQLLALLDSLIPTAEVDYLKQLIESILVVLNAPILKLGQLIVLLQQFYSALADYFFSIKTCFAPSTLRFLFQLLTNLIIVTSGTTSGGGAVIPYASGTPVVLATVADSVIVTSGLLGFGSSFGLNVSLASINLTSAIQDFAFVAPRDGTITSLAGFFSVTVGIALPGLASPVRVQMQLYKASATGNTFTPIGTPLLLDPAFTTIAANAPLSGIAPQAIPVAAQEKILLVVSLTTNGANLASAVTGFASAGITFE
ncbi:exosporium glycoprotein BclB-related protein [Bacillus hominis]|uniref:Exosporium glycoprotein BclB-related protein n=1 Tax=Bacillus hominis TaxID=2817478 RepID=A0ABT7R7D2_9BACI|nr:exosporium glycoprotein BclB-related protein [Bacillus hominis]MDM5438827.1 exosporium glycoprotein BclB-related protein [Bacillus hominis]